MNEEGEDDEDGVEDEGEDGGTLICWRKRKQPPGGLGRMRPGDW